MTLAPPTPSSSDKAVQLSEIIDKRSLEMLHFSFDRVEELE